HRRHRTAAGCPARAHPVDRQRNPAAVRETDHRRQPTDQLLPGLVAMATHPPSPRPRQPLPHPRRHRPSTKLYITFPGWTTSFTTVVRDFWLAVFGSGSGGLVLVVVFGSGTR